MVRHGAHRHWLNCGMIALALCANAGCLGFLNPVEPPRSECLEACLAVPACSRNHVYVFLMNGLDPVNCANLTGLRDCLQNLGFIKTYFGHLYHQCWFEKEIRRLHAEDPDHRFVLIGYGVGVHAIRSMATHLEAEGITFDVLVFLDCTTLDDDDCQRPGNCTRIVNIWCEGNLCKGRNVDDAENICLREAGPFGSPSHLITIQTLAHELVLSACQVPIVMPAVAPKPPATLPMPRQAMPEITKSRDDWDFLKPLMSHNAWPTLKSQRLQSPAPEGTPKKNPETISLDHVGSTQR